MKYDDQTPGEILAEAPDHLATPNKLRWLNEREEQRVQESRDKRERWTLIVGVAALIVAAASVLVVVL